MMKQKNKELKILLAVFGAVDLVFSFFLPISVALILVRFFDLTSIQALIVLMMGVMSSIYKGLRLIAGKE